MNNTTTKNSIGNKGNDLLRRALLGLLALGLLAASPAGAQAARHGRTVKQQRQQQQGGVVNINTASEEQLELLPGIGPSKARAVVHYRARRKFKATHELIRVRGIGRKTFRRLRHYLTVKGPTTLTARPPSKPQAKK